ncbi:MAG TPA: DUF4743 domain-containing protein [Limnobacter sp.]|nr:DUF4743 domain-containing protein [Limnobacter sp.]
MPVADRNWITQSLPATFSGFTSKWRDSSSKPAEQFLKLLVNGQHLGHVNRQHLRAVQAAFHAAGLQATETTAHLELLAPTNPQQFSAALASVGRFLQALNLVPGWRNEEQLVLDAEGQVLATAERALFKTLGLRTRAVHVHVENHLGQVWAGVRAPTKHENPGMLDNLAAGGVASAEDIQTTLWRELDEEAGLGPEDFTRIEPMYPRELALSRPLLYGGWHHETVLLYRGVLRPGHRPRNRDGEVAGFQLMNRNACMKAVNDWQFTPDAALCCALAMSQD